jgi:hypothetical protein
MATSTMPFALPGSRPKRWFPWPVAGTSLSLRKTALEATIQLKKWMGRRRRDRRSSPSEKKQAEAARRRLPTRWGRTVLQ